MTSFRNGNIISISLKNFQTFSNQKFTFGPSLNYIAAPNGSGKSSIANAIALVFNGTAKTIGKTKEIYSFIKFGTDVSEIVAEVFYEGKTNKLRRVISLAHNLYYINDKIVQQKEYFSYLKTLKIDVTNLCSFLPQERVGEFCRLDGKDLLTETLKSSEIDLSKVKDQYSERKEIEIKLVEQIKERELLAESLKILHEGALKSKEKENLEEKKNKLECMKYRINFDQNKEEYMKIKTRMHECKNRIEETEKKIEILVKKIEQEEKREEYEEHKKNVEMLNVQNIEIERIEEEIRKKITELEMVKGDEIKTEEKILKNKKEREENEIRIKQIENEYKEREESYKEKVDLYIRKIERNKTIDNLRDNNLIDNLGDNLRDKHTDKNIIGDKQIDKNLINLKDKQNNKKLISIEYLDKIQPSFTKLEQQISEKSFKISQISSISKEIQNKVEELEKQIKMNSEQDSLRLEAFKRYHSDSAKGVLWLRENKNLFKSEILEPSFLHITIDQNYTDYVETFLSYQALTSFIVKNESDFSLLTKILKDEYKLSINVAMSSNSRSQRLSKADLSRFNFDGVVSDFIECRNEYKEFFECFGHFGSIPISKREIKEEIVFDSLPSVKRMAVNGRYSEIRKSKYENDHVILTNKIQRKGLFYFPSFNKEESIEKIKELNREREINRNSMNIILEELSTLKSKRESIKKEFDLSDISQSFYNLDKIKRDLLFYQMKVNSQIDFSSVILQIKNKRNSIIYEISELSNRITYILDINNIPIFNLEKIKNLKLDLDNLKRSLIYENHLKQSDESSFHSMNSSKVLLRALLEDLKLKISERLYSLSSSALEEEKDLPSNLIEIDLQIDTLNAKLSFLKSLAFDHDDYSHKERKLVQIDENIRILSLQKDSADSSFDKNKKKVENEVNLFLHPIGRLFSEMFMRFGFEGKLFLDTSMGDWELKILVKFRENEDLQQLSSFRQSGGEKSLTTVLFLLSLQQCQETAFRLVDEINQGMDPVNESIVFEIIKEIGMNSQFFVITPKMLSKIEFSEQSKAIIVYGGGGITKDIEDYCKRVLS